jgi:FkbM family methyltransferase
MSGITLMRRAVGVLSRQLHRPELLAAVDPVIRQADHEAIAIAAVLAASLRPDSLYVDIGTNRGQVLGEAVRVAPRARHIAFEPIPALAEVIASRFPGVDCRRMALGAQAEETQFCHFTKLDGWSGLRRSPEISDEQGAPEFIDVTVSTIDSELGEMAPAVVKIDVEGAELGVLEGGRALLARTHPLIVFEHVAQASLLYGASSQEIWDLLSELGYTVYAVTGEGPFTREDFARPGKVVNWLATPTSLPQSSLS